MPPPKTSFTIPDTNGLPIKVGVRTLADGTVALGTIETPYQRARKITAGTPVDPGDAAFLVCTSPGIVRLILVSGDTLDVAVTEGSSMVKPVAVVDFDPAETTADCEVTVLAYS